MLLQTLALAALTFPLVQGVQEVAAAAEYVPGGQAKQALELAAWRYVPEGQVVVHSVARVALTVVPLQAVQTVAPEAE